MKVVCCACGFHYGNKTSDTTDDDTVSHGLCESCAHHFFAQVGMPLTQYLKGISVPVVTVSPEGTIGAANQKALEILEKTPVQVHGFKGGDVFECEHAMIPEGCGQTIHCSGCTVRITVMDTMQTGRSHRCVPAYISQYSDGGSRRIELFISTEKKGGIVFLYIEGISQAVPNKSINSDKQ